MPVPKTIERQFDVPALPPGTAESERAYLTAFPFMERATPAADVKAPLHAFRQAYLETVAINLHIARRSRPLAPVNRHPCPDGHASNRLRRCPHARVTDARIVANHHAVQIGAPVHPRMAHDERSKDFTADDDRIVAYLAHAADEGVESHGPVERDRFSGEVTVRAHKSLIVDLAFAVAVCQMIHKSKRADNAACHPPALVCPV